MPEITRWLSFKACSHNPHDVDGDDDDDGGGGDDDDDGDSTNTDNDDAVYDDDDGICTLFQLCSQYRTYISINKTLYTIKMHN